MRRRQLIVILMIIVAGLAVPVSIFVLTWIHDPVTNPINDTHMQIALMYKVRERITRYYMDHKELPDDVKSYVLSDAVLSHSDSVRAMTIRVGADGRTVEMVSDGIEKQVRGVFQLTDNEATSVESRGPWVEDPVRAKWPI